MISDQLVRRVERSLRKRLPGDLRGLLERYAARAVSEEAFITSASRLLLDPRERQHWLSVWTQRLQSRSFDTAPAPLDMPMPSASLPDVPSTATSTVSEDIATQAVAPVPATSDQVARLRSALADELGPLAFELVAREAARAPSAAALRDRLRALLDNDAQRTRFLRHTDSL